MVEKGDAVAEFNGFQECPSCRLGWKTRDDLLKDKNLQLIGYQANLRDLEKGFYLFNHVISRCLTTLSVSVNKFFDLYAIDRHTISSYGTEDCEGRCLRVSDLNRCRAKCKNAFAREILVSLLKDYPHLRQPRDD